MAKGKNYRPRKTGPRLRTSSKAHISRIPSEEMAKLKDEILQRISTGDALTVTEAAESLGLDPKQAYAWMGDDPNWAGIVRQTRFVLADRVEKMLLTQGNVVGLIFLAKSYAPDRFRDDFKIPLSDNRTRQLLEELRDLGKHVSEAAKPVHPPAIKEIPATSAPEPINFLAETVARLKKPALVAPQFHNDPPKEVSHEPTPTET